MIISSSNLTIAICTHNRANDVRECIDSIYKANAPHTFKEVLLIDSGSSQKTADELQKIANSQENCKYIRLEKPGLSLARNMALKQCETEWICYLDDDVIINQNWHVAIFSEIKEINPSTAAIGGMVSPKYPDGETTSHITNRWKLLLSCTEEPEPGNINEGKNLCGANLLFRKSALVEVGGFSENIGRIGEKLISGEESEVFIKLMKNGFECHYSPTFQVKHKISHERLKLQWVATRSYWEGYSQALIARNLGLKNINLNPFKLAISFMGCNILDALISSNADWLIRKNFAKGALIAQIAKH